MVAGFDRAKNVHCRDIRAGESTVVDDLLNACSCRSDLRRQLGQPTGSIANHGSKSAEPAVRDQTPLNYSAENIWVDVPTAKQ
jgi:hypothetical protein